MHKLNEARNELDKLSIEERGYLTSYLMGGCQAIVESSWATKEQKIYAEILLENIIKGCKRA